MNIYLPFKKFSLNKFSDGDMDECFFIDIDGRSGRFLAYNGSKLYLQMINIYDDDTSKYKNSIAWKLKDPGTGGDGYLFVTHNQKPHYFLSVKTFPLLSPSSQDATVWSILSGPYDNKFAIVYDIDFYNIEYLIWKDNVLQLIKTSSFSIPDEAYQWNNKFVDML